MKVCHIISGHYTLDVRVFKKECTTLAQNGYDVTLLCSDGEPDREIDGVKITSISKPPKSRINRFVFSKGGFFQKAKEINADVYHIHEPFLLGVGKKINKALGKKVIFDSHEDYPSMILDKTYIPKIFRKLVAKCYASHEKRCLKRYEAVVGVTPAIIDRLCKIVPKAVLLTNVPKLRAEIVQPKFEERMIVFPGLIEPIWNIGTIVSAINGIEDVRFEIRANSADAEYIEKLKALPGWDKVNYVGKVPQAEVFELMSRARAGIALANYCPELGWKQGSLGCTKFFEYMMAGIPVICTDFVLWEQIINEYNCGICVDPTDVDALRKAILYLCDNPDIAREMGINGRRAVVEKYNWDIEKTKLLQLYEELC